MAANRNQTQFTNYRAWQWIKHLALGDYVVPWAEILGSLASSIYVVDLFAGKGTYTDATGAKVDGSPVIFAREALRYRKKHPGRSLHLICCEKDRKNFKALSERVGGFEPLVTLLRGSFARHIDTIGSIIGNAPALILFDPIGLKQISAETIWPLLHRTGKTDVFMVLHFKVLHRTAGQLLPTGFGDPGIEGAEEAARTFDAVFGTPRWRFIAKNPRLQGDENTELRERAYLDLYYESVLGDRYSRKGAYRVRAKYLSKTQYWLVHASDHIRAHLLMNDEIVKLDCRLYEQTYGEGALPSMIETELVARIAAEEDCLRQRMFATVEAQGVMTFGDVREALLPEFFGRVKQGAYSRVAKSLVRDERLVREKRLAARFEDSERLALPATPNVGIASAA